MATVEIPDEYEEGVIESLEEMLFDVEHVEGDTYRVVDHDG